jgi:hypothetical protein
LSIYRFHFLLKLPIYAWQDGHNRLKICQELGIEP